MRRPPKFATALLRRLTKPDDAVLGDLVEHFQSGQSALWYWRQVIALIVQALVRDVQHSWPLVVVAIICGGVLTVYAPPLTAAIQTFDHELFFRGFRWFYMNGYQLPSIVVNHPWSITATVYALSGWAVGRVARHRQVVVVLAFAAAVFAGGLFHPLTGSGVDDYPMLSFSFHFAFHPIPVARILTQRFMVGSHADFMNVFVFNVLILPLMTLIGGLSARGCGFDESGVAA